MPVSTYSSMNIMVPGGEQQSHRFNFDSKRWVFWFLGIVLSFAPIYISLLYNYLTGSIQLQGLYDAYLYVMGNIEAISICVSLSLAAIFEWLANGAKNNVVTVAILILVAIICVVLYTLAQLQMFDSDDLVRLRNLTSVFFPFSFILGSILFIERK